ncbi:MAG: sugar phosphate isomerase/epimerase [Clostridia bacterium]|nr:sugar phosphate isomerase/epimerase [Clostridia bacterium]
MKQLRISSVSNLHANPGGDVGEFVREELLFQKEVGFDAMDIRLNLLDLTSDAWQAQAEQILKISDECGIRSELGHLPYDGMSDVANFSARMHRAIDASAALGLGCAVLHPNAVTVPMRKFRYQEQYDMVMNLLAPFAEHAHRIGLEIAIENMRVVPGAQHVHRFCQTAEEVCAVADALGIGVCWDFGHANISGLQQAEALAYVGKRLKVIHVNDNRGIDDEHILPFTGNVEWKDAMHGLALTGFDGLFNFELSPSRVPLSMRKTYATYLVESAKELLAMME